MKDEIKQLMEETPLIDYNFKKVIDIDEPWKGYKEFHFEITAPGATKADIEDIIDFNGWDQLGYPFGGGRLTYNKGDDLWKYRVVQDSGD